MNNELETVFECTDNCGEYAGCTDDGLLKGKGGYVVYDMYYNA